MASREASAAPLASPADREIGVEPPPQALVEALGAIDVGHRDGDDLELQIDRRGGTNAGGGLRVQC